MDIYTFDVYQGDKFTAGININDDAGLPMNLSGYDARGTIRTSYSAPGIQNFNCSFVNPVSGTLALSLSSLETSALPATQLLYDIEAYTSGDSDVFKILRGYVNVYPEVTHV